MGDLTLGNRIRTPLYRKATIVYVNYGKNINNRTLKARTKI